jgi:phosphoenolpyruvate carboxylase
LILPSWLGIGDALDYAIINGHRDMLRKMYQEWWVL